jgi:hypothetical protein
MDADRQEVIVIGGGQAGLALGYHLARQRRRFRVRRPCDCEPEDVTAIVQDEYGPAPEEVLRLEEIDKPTIGDDEVLVRVHAASVDRGTWHVMAGLPYPISLAGFGLRRPKHRNPGRSLARTIEAIGADATAFKPGDPVFGICDGSFAEYACVRPDKLAPKPANLPFDQAARRPHLRAHRPPSRPRPSPAPTEVADRRRVGPIARVKVRAQLPLVVDARRRSPPRCRRLAGGGGGVRFR